MKKNNKHLNGFELGSLGQDSRQPTTEPQSNVGINVAVFQWITSCHKNRVLTHLREYVTSLTTFLTTIV